MVRSTNLYLKTIDWVLWLLSNRRYPKKTIRTDRYSHSLLSAHAACYFSSELQGSFVTQSTVTDNEVHYSDVNITEDAIAIWGHCHKRIENNVILMIGSDETACFRCFHLKLVARNVLKVHTADKDYISKCYTNENKAIASCPSEDMLKDASKHTEIILYSKI